MNHAKNSISNCSAFDVAAYILDKLGEMSAWKLQKLVYYSQVWSLVWDGKRLFDQKIEAWINGPVCRELYEIHKGRFEINDIDCGDKNALNETQKESVDAVLKYYGDKSPQWLADLTHLENPWRLARESLNPNERGNIEISLESMAEYYESLTKEENMPID
ncbi:MAG: DUF4065 domain-containing protein [Flavobacteriaceae bacterium]|nr:DUF4065 domain-containing protein [Flavobacteriaceae bacterium]